MKKPTSDVILAAGVLCFLSSFLVVSVGHAEWGFWPWNGSSSSGSSMSSAAFSSSIDDLGTGRYTAGEERIIRVVKHTQPSVVSVIISKDLPVLEEGTQTVPFDPGFGFNDPFFQQFQIQVPQVQQKGTQKQEVGGGTAFFVSSDGLLMTNKHVVEDPSAQYTVLTNDGKKLDATVVARDTANDVALLRVKGSGFTPLTIASDDTLELGQTAIAIGNALGEFRNTVSVGAISGLSRSIEAGGMGGSTEELNQIIQTDAAINEGNSGGPLLDSRGDVIGMNTAIAASAQNIGFALPAKVLRNVLQSFQKNGRIVRPYIGIRYSPVTPAWKAKNKFPYDYGVVVVSGTGKNQGGVLKGSPADKAGLADGDVITEADGKKLTSDVSLLQLIQEKSPGDTVSLKYWRNGSEKTVSVTLEERKQ